MKVHSKIRSAVIIIILIIIGSVIIDVLRISAYKDIPSLPAKYINIETDEIYYDLVNGKKSPYWGRIDKTIDYINHQYDVSDFHLTVLLRILFDYREKIPASKMAAIKKCILKFRYWMDEPGENSMCYWSENHQILFASGEYLAGQFFPDDIFTNSGLTGKQHSKKARKRILDWLKMRWNYGFSEFYSTVYYNEDIAGLINLIDYAKDNDIVKKASIIMDLLIYDIASQKLGNTFVSVSGRAYKNGRTGGEKLSSRRIIDFLWNKNKTGKPHINYGFLVSKNYKAPPVLLEIGKDASAVIIKQSNGLNVNDLVSEGYGGADEKSIMMQWSMEAFTRESVIRNSLGYIRKNNMFSNEFLRDLRYLDFSLIKYLHLEPFLTNILNPQSNGAALQRGNTYTYKTNNYSVYTVQNYFPGEYADQQHVAGMNIDSSFSVFHTHPALPAKKFKQSPNYWVGYGRLPHSVQDSNVSLSIYNLPKKANILEMYMLHYTHAYFPRNKFDTVIIHNNYAFGKKGKTYCAFIGRNKLYYRKNTTDDLLQNGQQVFWVIQAGSQKEDGSFSEFCTKIMNNKLVFDPHNLALRYTNGSKQLKVKFGGKFYLNGKLENTTYSRYNSPYINASYKQKDLLFRFNNKILRLNFSEMKREFN